MSDDNTNAVILENIIAMRGELSAAIKAQEDLPQMKLDIKDLKTEQTKNNQDRKWGKAIAAAIGGGIALFVQNFPTASKAMSTLFHSGPS